MTCPYDVLGLTREASSATIRAAYRLLSKTHHPDVGGDAETFSKIKMAHDLLIDPVRRHRYDTTGDASESIPEGNVEAEIHSFITQTMLSLMNSGHDVESFDLISEMKAVIHKEIAQRKANIKGLDTEIAKLEKVKKRISRKTDGENYLVRALQSQIDTFQRMKEQAEFQQKNCTTALERVGEYSYDFKKNEMRSYNPRTNPMFVFQGD